MKELNFLFQKNYCRIERPNNICINVFCYENNLAYNPENLENNLENNPVYLPDQKFNNSMDLSQIADENKSHYVSIKDFKRFMCNKTKNEKKNIFLQMLFTVFQ